MGDVEDMAGSSTGVPIIEIFYHSTGSNAGASGLASLILFVGLGASNGLTASGGRSIYAFARDHGLPFSTWLSRVNTGNSTPVNGLVAAVGVQMVLLAIYFGASQGFNTVIAIATEGFCTFPPSRAALPAFHASLRCLHAPADNKTTDVSYALPLLARLLSLATSTPHRDLYSSFSLGRLSIPLNAIGLVYLLFTCITFNFPTVSPVNSENMNYTPAAVGVIMLIALVTWLTTGRKHFTGPKSGGVVLNEKGDVDAAVDGADGSGSGLDKGMRESEANGGARGVV